MKIKDHTLTSTIRRPWKEDPWIVGTIVYETTLPVSCHISLQLHMLCVSQFKETAVNDSYTQFETQLLLPTLM